MKEVKQVLTRLTIIVLFLISITAAAISASATNWEGVFAPGPDWGGGMHFGARPGYTDGYDGQSPVELDGISGVLVKLYRTWGGSPAFYTSDYESPIPAGESKIWSDIWLWSQNYTPVLGSQTRIWIDREFAAPSGYWGRLFLDYVPDGLDWAEPWYYDFPLDDGGISSFLLPVPITDNPYDPMQVTRMHLTVYTTPIPEPSSLLALGGGLIGLAGLALRRRRR